ncbi:hypothetical protein Syun_029935 [Stephania yunnanensis]|uniref:Uncharacterized protein n=1 Tax=Stephania yunnanensis TaxID=152371 RepID=A0AAP0HKB3_9MAGN
MLVFGMGLYELFVSNFDIAKLLPQSSAPSRSNLFGLFTLKERPKWLEIKSMNELKTKLGHVIVMASLAGREAVGRAAAVAKTRGRGRGVSATASDAVSEARGRAGKLCTARRRERGEKEKREREERKRGREENERTESKQRATERKEEKRGRKKGE